MQQFRNDYSEGAAPAILDALVRTNLEQCVGYGADEHCAHAAELIRAEIGQPNACVAFVPGTSFHPVDPKRNTLRFNFSNLPPATIRHGARVLCNSIREEMEAAGR